MKLDRTDIIIVVILLGCMGGASLLAWQEGYYDGMNDICTGELARNMTNGKPVCVPEGYIESQEKKSNIPGGYQFDYNQTQFHNII